MVLMIRVVERPIPSVLEAITVKPKEQSSRKQCPPTGSAEPSAAVEVRGSGCSGQPLCHSL